MKYQKHPFCYDQKSLISIVPWYFIAQVAGNCQADGWMLWMMSCSRRECWALFSQFWCPVWGPFPAAAPWGHLSSFFRTAPSCEGLQVPHWDQTSPAFTAPLLPSEIFLIFILQLPTSGTEFWWGERVLAKFICNFDTKKTLPKKPRGIMCYHLKCEISSKWRSLTVPKVEMPSFVPWSACSVQSARSTQVITFTTNGASHSDKMFQHYLITKLHYCSTTYRVKQFTCSIQWLSQMRKIYEYASKTAQSVERRHHPE